MLFERAYPELTAPQLKALYGLINGECIANIAARCKVSERTVRAWKQQPAFRKALVTEQSEFLQQSRAQLSRAAETAVETLAAICRDHHQKGSVRVAAAGKLLTLFYRHVPEASLALPAAPETAEADPLPATSFDPVDLSDAVFEPELAAATPSAAMPDADATPIPVAAQPAPLPMEEELSSGGPASDQDRGGIPLAAPSRRSPARSLASLGLKPMSELLTGTAPASPTMVGSRTGAPSPSDREPLLEAITRIPLTVATKS